MNISTKIKLRQKIKFVENLIIYSRLKYDINLKKIFFQKKICTKKI